MKRDIPINYIFEYPWLDTTNTRSVSCTICHGNNEVEQVFSFKVNGKEFNIERCLADDLMFLSPQPSGGYAETLYNHPSYFRGEDDMYGLAVSDLHSTQVARIRVGEIKKYLSKDSSDISMLEIGCAYGHTLIEARNQGFNEVNGIEFSKDAVEKCSEAGLDVVLGSVNEKFDTLLPQKQFDVVAFYSVLEHVNDPDDFIMRTLPLLHKDGFLVIRVPQMSKEGPWLSLLDHYWHFTNASIRALVEKNRLEIIDLFSSGLFVGGIHGGVLPSMTVIAKAR